MRVVIRKQAAKQLKKSPPQVQNKLATWVRLIKDVGLAETRKIPGFHDEPLQGKTTRSIRLSRQWRAEYRQETDDDGQLILVVEVHPHDY